MARRGLTDAAGLPLMGDTERGSAIKRRRLAIGIKSLREFAEATRIDRAALAKAERGEGSDATLERAEAWLDRFELETGMDEPATVRPIGDPADDLVEFTVEGHFGVRAVVKGPIRDIDKLQEAVARLIAGMDRPHPEA